MGILGHEELGFVQNSRRCNYAVVPRHFLFVFRPQQASLIRDFFAKGSGLEPRFWDFAKVFVRNFLSRPLVSLRIEFRENNRW